MDQLATVANIASWEAVLLFFLVGAGFLLGVLLGRDRIFLLLIGSYVSYALMCVIPFKKIFPKLFYEEENFVILIVAFLVLIGLIYFLLSRSLLKTAIQRKGRRSIFQIFFLSLFLIGIIITVLFSFFPNDIINQFSPVIQNIFNTSLVRALWLIVPLIFIGLSRKKRRYSRE